MTEEMAHSGEMKKNAAVLLVVIDAVGITTLEYLLDNFKGKINFANLSRLGLGRILSPRFAGRLGPDGGKSYVASLEQASASADSVIGHREMMGIIDGRTYDLFPDGFPKDYIAALEKKIGRKIIFNRMAGGMEAIELNASEHERTGCPIVYASKCDPLIQIAMNENVIPVSQQHAIAGAALELAIKMKIPLTRAIARAYVKSPQGEIIRTANRHDAVLPMKGKTLVDILYSKGVWTVSVGKISDLVNADYHERIKLNDPALLDPGLGLRFVHPRKKDTNPYVIQGIVNALASAGRLSRRGGTFIFANLVDTDSLYGHTRDIEGSLRCIEETDRMIPVFEKNLKDGDMLILTADHGMRHRADYGYHNKEPLPLIVEKIGCDLRPGPSPFGKDCGLTEKGKTLAGVGYIAAQAFGCEEEYSSGCGLAGESVVPSFFRNA